MGKDCRDVSEENWQDAIVGYTTILDMTEESILKGNDYVSGNPRYLTIVKNFPTFFSFGPELVTPDEVPDVNELLVQSVHNGEVHAEKRSSKHDPQTAASGIPAQQHPGLVRRRHPFHRNTESVPHPGWRCSRVPHHRTGRIRDDTTCKPGC